MQRNYRDQIDGCGDGHSSNLECDLEMESTGLVVLDLRKRENDANIFGLSN